MDVGRGFSPACHREFCVDRAKVAAVSFVNTIQPLIFDFLCRSCEIYGARAGGGIGGGIAEVFAQAGARMN